MAHSVLRPERVLDTLKAAEEVPRHPRLPLRGNSKGPAQLKDSPVSPFSSGKEGPFPSCVREGIPEFPTHIKRRQSPLDAREEIQGSCHHCKRPPMSQCTPDTPDSPALTRRSPRGLTQNTMADVTVLWHLERKPLIPMVNPTGNLTLLFRLERRADLHGSTRDEA